MSLTYPEGECFFRRTALDSNSPNGYHASEITEFYSHMMVEFIWNRWSDHGKDAQKSKGGFKHPRSGYKIVRGSLWDTDYGCWENLPFSYGPTFEDIRRRVQHNLCTNGNRLKDKEKGDPNEAWFMFMPMPTAEERWVWIDRLSYIRAIYFPVAYSADKDHPDLCSFVQVSFTLDRDIKGCTGADTFRPYHTDKVLGFDVYRAQTIGFDVTGLIELLTLPRQLRRDNCYNLKLLRFVAASRVKTVPVSKSYSDDYDKSWTAVAGGNYGLDLVWRPPEKSNWVENYIRNTLTIAIGYVPVVGPFLQIAFSVGWTLISEDDPNVAYELLKSLAPGVELTEHIIKELVRTKEETQAFLPDGWQRLGLKAQQKAVPEEKEAPKPIEDMDHTLPMLQQKEILKATGNDQDKVKPKSDDDKKGKTELENPEGDTDSAAKDGKQPISAVDSDV